MPRPRKPLDASVAFAACRWVEQRYGEFWFLNQPDHPFKAHQADAPGWLRTWSNAWQETDRSDEAARAELARQLDDYLVQWLTAKDWVTMRNTINRKKADERKKIEQNDRLVTLKLPRSVHSLVTQLVALDNTCTTQADALKKHLKPILERLSERDYQCRVKAMRDYLVNWPHLDLAALLVCLNKQSPDRVLVTDLLAQKNTPTAAAFVNAIEHSVLTPIDAEQPDTHDLVAAFEAEPGKWRGLAKRKWPQLKNN